MDENKKSHLIMVIVLLLVFLLVSSLFLGPMMDFLYGSWGSKRVYPEKADFTIERVVDMRNTGGSGLEYNLTMARPYNISGNNIQYIDGSDWNIQPTVYKQYDSEWNAWNGELAPDESEEIRINYDVRTTTVSWNYTAEDSATVDDIPAYLKERYNKNQWQLDEDRDGDGQDDWMIQPDHPEIESLAESIVEGEDNIYDKSKAISDWIDDNIEYELGRSSQLPQHAAWVLEDGRGDCDEQSFLYASLSRAVGIPAWMELGVLYDRGGDRWGGHGWIRTHIVGENGNGGWVNIDLVNDQFYFRDSLRLTTWVDDGGEDHIEEFYKYISWRGNGPGARLEVEDSIEDKKMETEGRVVVRNGLAIPGFRIWVAVPALICSIIIYSIRKRKKNC
ncbi:MAG: transglutaminase-like domain-containing protein [Thermoplasmata archaeon]